MAEDMITPGDLEALRGELKDEIHSVRIELKDEIATTRMRRGSSAHRDERALWYTPSRRFASLSGGVNKQNSRKITYQGRASDL